MKKQYIILLLLLSCLHTQAKNDFVVNEHNLSETGLLTIIPTFNPVGPICYGASLNPLPTVSNNGVTGTWSPFINNTATTTYTFTPNANQDAAIVTIMIIVLPNDSLSLASAQPTTSQTVCLNTPILPIGYLSNDNAVSITSVGLPVGVVGTFSSGIFSINGTPNALPGVYNYTVSTIGGCSTASLSGTITVSPSGNLNLFCDPTQTTSVNSVAFDWSNISGFGTYQYSYSVNGGLLVSGSTNLSHYEVFGVMPGQSVTFTILGATPCVDSASVTCNLLLANQEFEINSFQYYPNPIGDILNLIYSHPITKVKIFSLFGQELLSQSFDAAALELDLSLFKSGFYLVEATSGTFSSTFKIIKN
ncbi:MAG: T9SS type A sorting domain-containing protein [Burkholderiales bacterium]|nr:T9SS type A sorting domain-containing protein [Flavobacterium sp.]